MQEKYGYSGRTNDMSATEAPAVKHVPIIREQFEQVCKLIDNAHEVFSILEERISSILYNGPSPEGNAALGKCEPEPSVKFAEELLVQKAKLNNLIDRMENTLKRIEL